MQEPKTDRPPGSQWKVEKLQHHCRVMIILSQHQRDPINVGKILICL